MLRAFLVIALFASCKEKEKAAELKPAPSALAPDPSPAARSGKEPVEAEAQVGSGSATASPSRKAREVAKRVGVDLTKSPEMSAVPQNKRETAKRPDPVKP